MEISPYKIIKELGKGGMGEVFLAHDARLSRRVAVKFLHGGTPVDGDRRERFQREARIAASINHPAIVQVHDVGCEQGCDYIVMEYVDGTNLHQYLRHRTLTPSEAVSIALQIARGMAVLQAHDIIHRDLKCENILITRSGQIKIADFGIAKLQTECPLTTDGKLMGTYRSMSPEQVCGHKLDHRSDIFAFGVLLCEVLTGRSPFQDKTPFETMWRIVHSPPRVSLEGVDDMPESLLSLVRQLLHKLPDMRPRDFHHIVEIIEEIIEREFGHLESLALADVSSVPPSADESTVNGAWRRNVETPQAEPATSTELPAKPPAKPFVVPTEHKRVALPSGWPYWLWRHRASFQINRYRLSAFIAGVLIVTVVLASFFSGYPVGHGRSTVPRVAILLPKVVRTDLVSGVASVHSFRGALWRALSDQMVLHDGVYVVRNDEIASVVRGYAEDKPVAPSLKALMASLGVQEVVQSTLSCQQSTVCRFEVVRRDQSGTILAEVAVELDVSSTAGSLVPLATIPDALYGRSAAAGYESRLSLGDYVRLEELEASFRRRQPNERTQNQSAENQSAGVLSREEILSELAAVRLQSSHSVSGYLLAAEILLDESREEEARTLLAQVGELAPDSLSLAVRRFFVAMRGGDLAYANSVLEHSPVRDAAGQWRQMLTGRLLVKRGEYDGAVEFLRDLDHTRHSWRAMLDLVMAEKELGHRDRARAYLAQLLERTPGNYDVLSQWGRLDYEHGDYACALARYEGIVSRLRVLPDEQIVTRRLGFAELHNLSVVKMLLGDHEGAVVHLEEAARREGPDGRRYGVFFDYGETLLLLGRDQEALASLRTFLRRAESAPGAHSRSSRILMAQARAHVAHITEDKAALARVRQLDRDIDSLQSSGWPSANELYGRVLIKARLGEVEAAATYARLFLILQGESGLHWLHFPWFAEVREHLRRSGVQLADGPRTC